MTCMCGDTECPSCGLAQGTLDERDALRATADLIAAAPDLYAAAIAARDENRHGDGSSKSLAALDKLLCDAIAKAKGRA